MTTQQAFVTAGVLRWARERAGASHENVADRLNTNSAKVISWERGAAWPTMRQAKELANFFRVPFGYLFLSEPPVEALPIPDFRTVRREHVGRPSPELVNVLSDALIKQQWYREFLEEAGQEQLEFVGRFGIPDGVQRVAEHMRNNLRITADMRRQCANWEDFLREFIARAEQIGVSVLRSGTALGNTHLPLSVHEFRGFSLSDTVAPLVFINGADSRAAQIFSLAHELAHIWTGSSGISNQNLKTASAGTQSTEIFCNAVAAELLVPADDIRTRWKKTLPAHQNVPELASYYRVSTLVVLRRSHDLGYITGTEYNEYYAEEETRYRRGSGGGGYYNNVLSRNGRSLTFAVLSALGEGKILHRDAARMLSISVPKLAILAERLKPESR